MKIIKISQGFETMVSDKDYKELSKYNWAVVKKQYKKYARAYINKKATYMHRIVSGFQYVDHIDGDGLNNQRGNLRAATKSQNMANRGLQINNQYGLKGVTLKKDHPRTKPWLARIKINNKQINLGYSKTKQEAAKLYNNAAIKYFGEFARLNPID